MRITDRWQSDSRPTLSFELFPARTEKAAAALPAVLDDLAALGPDFVSVTFGAGGSTREGSRQLIETLIKEKGLNVMAYFAGFGLGPDDIIAVLDGYRAMGVENVLAVRGDPPHGVENFMPHPRSLPHASDLLSFVTSRYDFCIGCAGYPEAHPESASPQKDLDFLKLKVDNGAMYIICNYFYENSLFFRFRDRCEAAGIQVPILPGVMPIYSIKMMDTLAKLCGASIPESLRVSLDVLPEGDTQALLDFGAEYAAQQCCGLLENGVPGLHLYTMDRSASVKEIIGILRDDGMLPSLEQIDE